MYIYKGVDHLYSLYLPLSGPSFSFLNSILKHGSQLKDYFGLVITI